MLRCAKITEQVSSPWFYGCNETRCPLHLEVNLSHLRMHDTCISIHKRRKVDMDNITPHLYERITPVLN